MRKIFLFTNVSLDGYFEGPGHGIYGLILTWRYSSTAARILPPWKTSL